LLCLPANNLQSTRVLALMPAGASGGCAPGGGGGQALPGSGAGDSPRWRPGLAD
jgi:hypothetical protein